MGHKIFVSYKFADDDVYNITNSMEGSTVRDYVDKIEETLKSDESDHIYKGESDGEDLSYLSDDTIWQKLRNRIYDSTLTIVMISPNMRNRYKKEKQQWIPREISYCLKEVSRIDKNGTPVKSKTNAMLAVVVPDKNNDYSYYTYEKICCTSGCRMLKTDTLFEIMRKNMFNLKDANKKDCEDGSTIWYGDSCYISSVKWEDFIKDKEKYIDKAYEIQDKIEDYDIHKDV